VIAVLDTNVIASGLRGYRHSYPGIVLRAWRDGYYHLIVSEHILNELSRTLANRYFSRFISAHQAAAVIELLRSEATVVPITQSVHAVATHPEDDLILATAVSGGANYLVTGDTQLLRLARYGSVEIISARSFAQLITASDDEPGG
jgi:putative PIN family toxin of toxin-antitoxin system